MPVNLKVISPLFYYNAISMKIFIILAILFIGFASCNKETAEPLLSPANEATYQVKISLTWTSPSFTVPVGAHFSNFVGMVHSVDTFMWQSGKSATKGLEYIAEIGSDQFMENEMDSIISRGQALSRFKIGSPGITGTIDTVFNFTLANSSLSFASMIAPSPDWFVGINNVNLLADGQWTNEFSIPLYAYDAGTEEGDVFDYTNPETLPWGPVQLLSPANASVLANGNAKMAAMGTVTFKKR